MKTIALHRQLKQGTNVPACMSAYWSNQFSIDLGNDRTPEITAGSREGSGYA